MSESAPPRQAPLKPTTAEREVADLLPIDADPDAARAVLDRVPFWFHTFSLDRSDELYTPGVARDHRYRIPALPEDFSGMSVLDVGTFDGFYAFLAEARGAGGSSRSTTSSTGCGSLALGRRARGRRGVHGDPGVARLDGRVPPSRCLRSDQLNEAFDLIVCFGILHRVDNPLGLLNVLRRRLSAGGRVLLKPTAQPIGRSTPRRRSTPMRQARSTLATTSCTGASARQSRAMAEMRASGVRALRRPGYRRSSARHRHATRPGALATCGPPWLMPPVGRPSGAAETAGELKERIEAERDGRPSSSSTRTRRAAADQGAGRGGIASASGAQRGGHVSLGFYCEASRAHAELERVGGEWALADDGLSRNGSFVNRERVVGRRRLRDGDELMFGDTIGPLTARPRRPGRRDAARRAPRCTLSPRPSAGCWSPSSAIWRWQRVRDPGDEQPPYCRPGVSSSTP